MHLTMDVTTLLATLGVTAALGSFGIAIARIKKGRGQVNNSDGRLNTGKVMTLISSKLKEFWEGPCKVERDNQEKMLVIHQKMYRVELKAATTVLQGEVGSIKGLLEEGLGRIDKRIEELNGALKGGKGDG